MRLASINFEGATKVAVETPAGFFPVDVRSMLDLIRAGDAGLSDAAAADRAGPPARGARLLAPLQPGKVLCAGINYASHLGENPKAVRPTRPFFFAKLTSAVIGPDAPIVKPSPDTQLDPEVELGVVIGRRARGLTARDALSAVFGYTILNDVSAREWQFAPDAQMMLSKGMDSFCPLGPVIVTTDEISDPSRLGLRTRVNGELRQNSTTAENLFDLGSLLEALSRDVTLEPGDIISTGTPAGVGLFRSPQAWLHPGDVVELEIDGIGNLRNPVVAGWSS